MNNAAGHGVCISNVHRYAGAAYYVFVYKYRTDCTRPTQASGLSSDLLCLPSAPRSHSELQPVAKMIFGVLFVQALLALSVLALPTSRERLLQRIARRSSSYTNDTSYPSVPISRLTSPAKRVTGPATCVGARCNSTDSLVYTSNWAGAVLQESSVSISWLC